VTPPEAGASRLDLMIARLLMQRACLDRAAELIAALPGPVLELGLGKGRTYDHLRRILPGREVFVFDRDVHAPAAARPDADHLIVGDMSATLPATRARIGAPAALAHADIGSEDRAADALNAVEVGKALADLMAPGGIVVSDRDLAVAAWSRLDLPQSDSDWPYLMWRVG
jgi:hypothetical protein